jgi:repressor LexA
MSNALTPTEEKVYQYLIEFLAANSYQPSIREIGRQFEIKSTKTVSDVLGSLARKGYIQRNQARSRGLRILGAQGGATRAIPFYHTLSAFGAAVTPDAHTDAIHIDRRLTPNNSAYFVRVCDAAMAACGIRANDTVLVNPEFAPQHGDLVAARVGHDAVIRTAAQRGATLVLVAAEHNAPEIEVPPGNATVILGVVSAVFRGVLAADTGDDEADAAA